MLIALLLLNLFEEISTNTPVVTDVELKTESASEENNTEKKLELKNSKEAQIVDVQEETSPIRQDTSIEQIVSTEGLESTSVLIKSSKKEQVKNLIEILDQEVPKGEERIRVYYLEHASAEDLVKVLLEIPSQDAKKAVPGLKKAPILSTKVKIMADKATNVADTVYFNLESRA